MSSSSSFSYLMDEDIINSSSSFLLFFFICGQLILPWEKFSVQRSRPISLVIMKHRLLKSHVVWRENDRLVFGTQLLSHKTLLSLSLINGSSRAIRKRKRERLVVEFSPFILSLGPQALRKWKNEKKIPETFRFLLFLDRFHRECLSVTGTLSFFLEFPDKHDGTKGKERKFRKVSFSWVVSFLETMTFSRSFLLSFVWARE